MRILHNLYFAGNMRESARPMPEADNLNLLTVTFQPVDDAI